MKRVASILIFTLLFSSLFSLIFANGYTNVTVSEAKSMIDSNPSLVVLDVRTQSEYDSGHIRNAKLIPVTQLEGRLGELNKTDEILVYCKSGGRSSTASQILADNGFLYVYNMLGGITSWKYYGYPVYVKYSSIQEAINNANEEDTIFVSSGTYYENVIVNKSVSLVGENVTNTVVDGKGEGTVFKICLDGVGINGFTVMHGEMETSDMYGRGECGGGFWVNSSHNVINSNKILDNTGCGIDIVGHDNTITNNNIYCNAFGIFMLNSYNNYISGNGITENSCGFTILSSPNNTLRENSLKDNMENFAINGGNHIEFLQEIDITNTVNGKPIYYWINQQDKRIPIDAGCVVVVNSNNITIRDINITNNGAGVFLVNTSDSLIENMTVLYNTVGIYLRFSGAYGNIINENLVKHNAWCGILLEAHSHHNMICNNIIKNNSWGLHVCYTNSNLVHANTIESNNYGVHGHTSYNNTIYCNNFVDNEVQVYDISWDETERDPSINNWNSTYPSGGNYWSDYNGTDLYGGSYQNITGSDGIGDTQCIIDGNNTDMYPLMIPFGPLTMKGENITVFPTDDIALIFENVTSEGFTTVNKTEIGPESPTGFKLAEQYYNIKTTANYLGKITIRIIYNDSNMAHEEEEVLRLMQWNGTSEEWVDITTCIDTQNNLIYGETIHLSLFGIIAPLINDVAVNGVTPSKTVVGEAYSLQIKVALTSEGDFTKTINVNVYANTTVIKTLTNLTLPSGNSTTITFTWNTTGFAKGNYTISANVTEVLGEIDLTDNVFIDGIVLVTFPGDVNGDGKVRVDDVLAVALAFGSDCGDPEYNANLDIIDDCKIRVDDVLTVALHFGEGP